MKHILLPTDFSENAYNAIAYAVQLYKDVPCKFYLLHTYTPATISSGHMMDTYSALKIQEIEKDNADTNLKALKNRIVNTFNNENHEFIEKSAYNLLLPEMEHVIESNNISLVIMGTKGATGAKEIFMGTNTMFAIKNLKCPVLAVPAGFKFETPTQMLFPTDYKFEQTNRYLDFVKHLSKLHDSKIHILNANYSRPLEDEQVKVKAFLETFFIDNAHAFHIGENQDLIEVITAFESKHKINFLVMIHNKHTFFEKLFFTPIINKMVYHTNVPFLVIPSEARIGD